MTGPIGTFLHPLCYIKGFLLSVPICQLTYLTSFATHCTSHHIKPAHISHVLHHSLHITSSRLTYLTFFATHCTSHQASSHISHPSPLTAHHIKPAHISHHSLHITSIPPNGQLMAIYLQRMITPNYSYLVPLHYLLWMCKHLKQSCQCFRQTTQVY